MRSQWPIMALAAGLGALHIAITITFGAAIASAIVAGLGIAYAAFNFLLGRAKDAPETKEGLARFVATSKVTYVALVLVWLAAVALALYPVVDRMLSEEFTITLVDEQRQPATDANLQIRFGGDVRRVPLEKGVGTVRYYPSRSPAEAEILVDNKGVRQTIVHRMGADRRFADLVIPVWSGQPVLGVAHLTATGVGISAFLRGDLPEDLRGRYPRVTVVRNAVFETAQEFAGMYRKLGTDTETASFSVSYSRTERNEAKPARRVEANTYGGEGDAWLAAYQRRVSSFPAPEPLLQEFELDMSQEILGAPAARPLPQGFLARLNSADEWIQGNEARPSPETDAWIRAHPGPGARGPGGTVSLRLERLISAADVSYMLDKQRGFAFAYRPPDPEALAYLRYMIGHGMPEGLIGGKVHLDPGDGCAYPTPHVELYLPEPELRVTVLHNSGDRPVRIDEMILTMQGRSRLQRVGAPARTDESRIPSDVLQPGDALLVPRELTLKATYTDEEIAEFRRADAGPVATFALLPREPAALFEDPETGAARPQPTSLFHRRPRQVMLSTARLRPTTPDRLLSDELIQGLDKNRPNHFVGPSVSEVDYVVNGVRMRARSDKRTVIAMIGSAAIGSCPFVFAHVGEGGAPLNLGPIIADRIGRAAQGRDRMAMPEGFSKPELRELEDEISYLDSARLIVRRGSGTSSYPALNRALGREDQRYAVLRKGERLALDFGYVRRDGDGEAVLEVSGYYEPTRPTARRP